MRCTAPSKAFSSVGLSNFKGLGFSGFLEFRVRRLQFRVYEVWVDEGDRVIKYTYRSSKTYNGPSNPNG